MAAKIYFLAFVSVVCGLLGTLVEAKTYCTMDSDCTYLGSSLACIKSSCNWGICGCPRGKAARYLGSDKLYQCVPLRKIGEACSFDGENGVCAAKNSECSSDGKCKCTGSYVSLWGGERCGEQDDNTIGDTCTYAGSTDKQLGKCDITGGTCQSFTTANTYGYSLINKDTPTCACTNTQRLDFVNDFSQTHTDFLGRAKPQCVTLKIGETCLQDSDCPSNAVCTSNKCACNSTYTASYGNVGCTLTSTLLTFGAKCAGSVVGKECDGSLGLVCGDSCNLNEVAADKTCMCGAQYTTSGSTCVAKSAGASCYGDENCKGLGNNAVCVLNKCQTNGVAIATGSMLTMAISLLVLMSANY